jgi:hypothetical protein
MIDPGIAGFLAFACSLFAAFFTAKFVGISIPEQRIDPARFGAIDGLRGYLALSVLAHHFLISWNFTRVHVWQVPDSIVFANL